MFSEQLHRFHSSTIKAEEVFTNSCWGKCLANKNSLIPAYKIVINNQEVLLNTLYYFKNLIHGNKKPLSNNSKILSQVRENLNSVLTNASADTGESFVST